MKRRMLVASVLLAASALVESASAQVISFNVDVNGTIGTVDATGNSGAGALAGVVSAGYWTGTWNGSYQNFTPTGLLDSNGNATTLAITGTGFNSYSIQGSAPGQSSDSTWNGNLLNGYMNAGTGNSPSVSTFTLSQIPYSLYDIYVYFSSDTAGRAGTVSNGATTYDFSTMGPNELLGANGYTFTQTTDTGGANPSADYAVFSNLNGAGQTITANIPAYGGLAGIQIVAVPEPGTMALAGMGGLALLVLLRRRKSSAVQV